MSKIQFSFLFFSASPILIEEIRNITSHNSKDLVGWHVYLNVIQGLLDNRVVAFREEEWKRWYEKYIVAIEKVSENR